MKNKKFSIKKAFEFGWETFKSSPGFFIGLVCIIMLVQFIPDLLAKVTEKNVALFFFTSIGFSVLQLIVSIGMIRIMLNFYDKKSAKMEDLFSCTHYFFRYFFATALYSLIVLIGFILLIIPGIILTIRLRFYGYFIVDKDMRAIESLKASMKATKGEGWNLFLFVVVAALLNFAGILALLIGLIVTIPVTALANAYVYRKLVHKDVEEEELTPEIAAKPAVIDNVSIMV